ncbi:MAG TPA: AbrB/MazE/SpoVT family DNA-binding domain-containing protein [Thiobacillus sp.]
MQTAKLFKNGRSQAVRLPAEYRFEGDEVLIRRDPVTGDIILSPRNKKFEDWVKLRDRLLSRIPQEDLAVLDDLRDAGPHAERDWP